MVIVSEDESLLKGLEALKESVMPLMLAKEILLGNEKKDVADDAVSVVVPGASIYLPMEELVDFEQEKERLSKEKERLHKEIARAKGMLANEKFLNKAPAQKVQEEKEKLEKYSDMLGQVEERMKALEK